MLEGNVNLSHEDNYNVSDNNEITVKILKKTRFSIIDREIKLSRDISNKVSTEK